MLMFVNQGALMLGLANRRLKVVLWKALILSSLIRVNSLVLFMHHQPISSCMET